jgi:hypothetical protein
MTAMIDSFLAYQNEPRRLAGAWQEDDEGCAVRAHAEA